LGITSSSDGLNSNVTGSMQILHYLIYWVCTILDWGVCGGGQDRVPSGDPEDDSILIMKCGADKQYL
jgi:hypothetical protein